MVFIGHLTTACEVTDRSQGFPLSAEVSLSGEVGCLDA